MRAFFAVVLATWTTAGMAQVPTGQFSYAFTNAPLWDASGIYTNTDPSGNDTLVANIQQQASGQVTAVTTETYDDHHGNHSEGTRYASGRVFDKAGAVGLSSNGKGTYSGVSGGVSFVANVTVRGTWVVVPSSLTLMGSASFRFCYVGGKCINSTSAADLPLPQDMNGDWALTLDTAADGNKLTGTGTLTLSNGRQLSYNVSGSYNTKSQVAKLHLVGSGNALGTSLTLTTQGVGMDLVTLKGRVLGQTLKLP